MQTGQQTKDAMVTEMARMMAQQDAAGRTAEQLREQAARQVDKLIQQGIYADPLASFDMGEFIRKVEREES